MDDNTFMELLLVGFTIWVGFFLILYLMFEGVI